MYPIEPVSDCAYGYRGTRRGAALALTPCPRDREGGAAVHGRPERRDTPSDHGPPPGPTPRHPCRNMAVTCGDTTRRASLGTTTHSGCLAPELLGPHPVPLRPSRLSLETWPQRTCQQHPGLSGSRPSRGRPPGCRGTSGPAPSPARATASRPRRRRLRRARPEVAGRERTARSGRDGGPSVPVAGGAGGVGLPQGPGLGRAPGTNAKERASR